MALSWLIAFGLACLLTVTPALARLGLIESSPILWPWPILLTAVDILFTSFLEAIVLAIALLDHRLSGAARPILP